VWNDPATDHLPALAAFDLPHANSPAPHPETALDEREMTTHNTGRAIRRRVLQRNGTPVMRRERSPIASVFPPEHLMADGQALITVARRVGARTWSRQGCCQREIEAHVIPGNAVCPSPNGIIITRGLQAWVCAAP
jgi:hypothetical protein